MRPWLFLILFAIPILACNLNNDNDPLPTLASTLAAPTIKVTPPTAAPASTKPAATQLLPTPTNRPNVTNPPAATMAPTTAASQPDKGDDLDKLLDELNNALNNIDTMDDVK